MKKNRVFSLIISVLAIMMATVSMAATPAQTTLPVEFDPANFAGDEIDNPYFPLIQGTTFVYRGAEDGTPKRDVVTVTSETKEILGVTTTVVHHNSYEEGVLVEDTYDWYAQDKDGNVWYFGEDTSELDEDGNVISTEGSWEAGVDGAEAGILMLADPQVGISYPQEIYPGVAEGMAEVIGYEDSLCVKYGCFENVLVIKEWSPLDEGIVEEKYYAPGIGFIYETLIEGGDGETELVRIRQQNNNDDDNDNDNGNDDDDDKDNDDRNEGRGGGRDD